MLQLFSCMCSVAGLVGWYWHCLRGEMTLFLSRVLISISDRNRNENRLAVCPS
jgi:hypothetical protein